MKFTLSWLKEFLDTDASLENISSTLTALGLEVEEITNQAETLGDFIVAEILEANPHPNADKLQVCKVHNGSEILQIVCGAPNARAGIKVVLASVGVVIPNGDFKIRASKIRDVESNGMLCSETELGLGDNAQGIMELPVDAKPGTRFVDAMGLDDPVIEIAITPNRGDCLGVYGIARDLAAAGVGTLRAYKVPSTLHKDPSPIQVHIENQDACPLFVGCTVEHVTNGESPDWLQQRLKAIGLSPISALVDITNYIAFTYGRPLHVYDIDKLDGNLVVRSAKSGETITALNEKEYTLEEGMTVIADNAGVQAIGGVIGGEASGVSASTSRVFLEVALFNSIDVARTGRKLQIDTDSRYRFERNVDPAFVHDAAALTLQMIHELCGGEASEWVSAGQVPAWERSIAFAYDRVASLGGMQCNNKEITNILSALGFSISDDDKEVRKVAVPSWRSDIEGSADLVEEVLRIVGYDALEPQSLPCYVPEEPVLSVTQKRLTQARRVLAARGLHEAITWSFMSSDMASHFGGGNASLRLVNPISSDLDEMRPSILPHLIDAVRRNADRGFSNAALFEIGPIFADATPQGRANVITLIRSGAYTGRNVHGDAREVDIFDIKADMLAALTEMGAPVDNLKIRTDALPAWYYPGRAGDVCLGKQVVARFGMLHPRYASICDIEGTVVMAEIFADNLPVPKAKKGRAKPSLVISDYQAVQRDFAFVLDQSVTAEDIIRTVNGADKKLIQSVTLFDVYQGKGVENGQKSVALSVTLQARDRTLSEEDIDAVSKQVIAAAEKQLGAVLRG